MDTLGKKKNVGDSLTFREIIGLSKCSALSTILILSVITLICCKICYTSKN